MSPSKTNPSDPLAKPESSDTSDIPGSKVACACLAAGASRRFGLGDKLTALPPEGVGLSSHGSPATALLELALAPLAKADFCARILVHKPSADLANPDAQLIANIAAKHGFQPIANPDWASGQSTSVHCAVKAARETGADWLLITLGDMPFVQPDTIQALLRARTAAPHSEAACESDVLYPTYQGKRGNPVLWHARLFNRLTALAGDTGARAILEDTDTRQKAVPVNDPGIHIDIDRPQDWQQLTASQR